MGFLIRSALWLALVMLVIPFGGKADDAQSVGPVEAIQAARVAIGDIGGICERQPGVCETGRAALQTIALRAQEASRLAIEMLDDNSAEPEKSIAGILEQEGGLQAPSDALMTTGSVAARD